mmetsp:Transcript_134134/g.232871  ORF Transcript_134134/g.232871 Transcript_134134/m.232871 type:complete len:201 (-) Transcript_134134:1636-2238(-)
MPCTWAPTLGWPCPQGPPPCRPWMPGKGGKLSTLSCPDRMRSRPTPLATVAPRQMRPLPGLADVLKQFRPLGQRPARWTLLPRRWKLHWPKAATGARCALWAAPAPVRRSPQFPCPGSPLHSPSCALSAKALLRRPRSGCAADPQQSGHSRSSRRKRTWRQLKSRFCCDGRRAWHGPAKGCEHRRPVSQLFEAHVCSLAL